MKTERLLLSLIAGLIGLLVAGGAFYFYQRTQNTSQNVAKETSPIIPSPTIDQTTYLVIDKPEDEAIVTSKTVTISGKTNPENTVVVSSETNDQVINPATNGNFSLTHTISDGVNILIITAILPDGREKSITRTITYSTENF